MSTLHELPSYARLPLDVVGAEGDELILADGRRILDLYGGHCVNVVGAGDSALLGALQDQWRSLSFATNLLPLRERDSYLRALEATLPPGDWRSFLSNSGAEANENALKAAFSATGRNSVVAFTGAFHGRTAGVAALNDGLSSGFPHAPYGVRRVAWGDTEAAMSSIDSDVACVILEPIQSMAGVVVPPAGFLEALRERCTETGSLLAFDEVQSGSGRLGKTWGSMHFGVTPDIFTSAKGLGGGLPVGLTVVSEAAAERVDAKLFGSTFGGGPLALAAASHVARRILEPGFLDAVVERSEAFRRLCASGPVKRVRGVGLLLGLELHEGLQSKIIRDELLEQGVFVGTSQDPRVLRISPALNVSEAAPPRLARALQSIHAPANH